jgi:hypothetical protein
VHQYLKENTKTKKTTSRRSHAGVGFFTIAREEKLKRKKEKKNARARLKST